MLVWCLLLPIRPLVHLCSHFDSKQSREPFVTPKSCESSGASRLALPSRVLPVARAVCHSQPCVSSGASRLSLPSHVILILCEAPWPYALMSLNICSLISTTHMEMLFLMDLFPLFYKSVADIVTSKLRMIFRGPIRQGSLPMCWCSANVIAIPKGAHSSKRQNYCCISIIAPLPTGKVWAVLN